MCGHWSNISVGFSDWHAESNGTTHFVVEGCSILMAGPFIFALGTWVSARIVGPAIKGYVGSTVTATGT